MKDVYLNMIINKGVQDAKIIIDLMKKDIVNNVAIIIVSNVNKIKILAVFVKMDII